MNILQYEKLEQDLPRLQSEYKNASPYPHIVIDNFLEQSVADQALKEFPGTQTLAWKEYKHVNSQKKFQKSDRSQFPEVLGNIMDELNSPRFVLWLSKLCGLPTLEADLSMAGGGMHQSEKGGFLNVHADFTVHPANALLMRRVNVLIYFNKDWKTEYNGQLEMWNREMKGCEKKISPDFNRCVIFYTPGSFHGHPDPLACPTGVSRKSLALYYYTKEEKPTKILSTEYRARPNDSAVKGVSIYLDKLLLRAVDRVRRILGMTK
ncbi:2OG-Fe(II) oxygenase [Candidatus Parcubacteria bacterium]|nr:2OG-Fe(II) oxygenase [Candidatus Parcubacteria bacterium]